MKMQCTPHRDDTTAYRNLLKDFLIEVIGNITKKKAPVWMPFLLTVM